MKCVHTHTHTQDEDVLTCLLQFPDRLLLVYESCVIQECLDSQALYHQDNPTLTSHLVRADHHEDTNHIVWDHTLMNYREEEGLIIIIINRSPLVTYQELHSKSITSDTKLSCDTSSSGVAYTT